MINWGCRIRKKCKSGATLIKFEGLVMQQGGMFFARGDDEVNEQISSNKMRRTEKNQMLTIDCLGGYSIE